MKTLKLFAIMIALVMSTAVFAGNKNNNDTTVCYKVSMDCLACKQKIEKNIAFEKGVKSIDVSLADQTVKIKYNSQKNNAEQLKTAIEKLHYEVQILPASK